MVIGAGAAQGAPGCTITAPGSASSLGVFVDAGGNDPIARVDAVLPETASTEAIRAARRASS